MKKTRLHETVRFKVFMFHIATTEKKSAKQRKHDHRSATNNRSTISWYGISLTAIVEVVVLVVKKSCFVSCWKLDCRQKLPVEAWAIKNETKNEAKQRVSNRMTWTWWARCMAVTLWFACLTDPSRNECTGSAHYKARTTHSVLHGSMSYTVHHCAIRIKAFTWSIRYWIGAERSDPQSSRKLSTAAATAATATSIAISRRRSNYCSALSSSSSSSFSSSSFTYLTLFFVLFFCVCVCLF